MQAQAASESLPNSSLVILNLPDAKKSVSLANVERGGHKSIANATQGLLPSAKKSQSP